MKNKKAKIIIIVSVIIILCLLGGFCTVKLLKKDGDDKTGNDITENEKPATSLISQAQENTEDNNSTEEKKPETSEVTEENNNTTNNTATNNNTSATSTNNTSSNNNSNTGNSTSNNSTNSTNNNSSTNNSNTNNNTNNSNTNNNNNTTQPTTESPSTTEDEHAGQVWVEDQYDWVWHPSGEKERVETPIYETRYKIVCRCGREFTSPTAVEEWAEHSTQKKNEEGLSTICRGYDNIPYYVQVGTDVQYIDGGEWVYEVVVPAHWE